MLIWLLTSLTLAAGTNEEIDLPDDLDLDVVRIETAEPASVRAVRTRSPRIRLPPMRFDVRAALRDTMLPGPFFEYGVQVARSERWTFDLNVGHSFRHGIEIPGPARAIYTWEVSGHALYEPNHFLTFGPVVGIGYRTFDQQWTAIDELFVPFGGLKANLAVIKSRKFGVEITSRFVVEGVQTRMILDTQQVQDLSIFEGQLGARLAFGYGRRP